MLRSTQALRVEEALTAACIWRLELVVAGGRACQKQQQVLGGLTQGRSDHREETHSIRVHISVLGTN